MHSLIKTAKFALPALLLSTVSVAAATVDFTTNSLVSTATGFSGSTGGLTYTLDGSPNAANKGDSVPGSASDELAAAGLAGDFDGIGIVDDEVGQQEFLTLTFNKKVKLTAAYFLDLFISKDDASEFETARITDGDSLQDFDAYNVYPQNGGFGAFATVGLVGTTFLFFDSSGNDDIGVGDYALAGLDVAPIPLPAGFLLLGTAVGGLGLARRRKKAQKA